MRPGAPRIPFRESRDERKGSPLARAPLESRPCLKVGGSENQSFGPAAMTSGAQPPSNRLKFSTKRVASDRYRLV